MSTESNVPEVDGQVDPKTAKRLIVAAELQRLLGELDEKLKEFNVGNRLALSLVAHERGEGEMYFCSNVTPEVAMALMANMLGMMMSHPEGIKEGDVPVPNIDPKYVN